MAISRSMFAALRAHHASRERVRTRPYRPLQPDHLRRAYYARLNNGPLATLKSLLGDIVRPGLGLLVATQSRVARADAIDPTLGAMLDDVKAKMDKEWPRSRFASLADPIGWSVERFQSEQLNRQLRKFVSVDVVGSEAWLAGAVSEFTVENVALIKSISAEFLSDLEKNLARVLADGGREEELAALIAERYSVAESRAKLIARDQVGKFNGDLNRARQTDLGIRSFIWRTENDERVRPEHAALNGEEFTWSEGAPEEGFPGEPVACRCYPDPVLPESSGDSNEVENESEQ